MRSRQEREKEKYTTHEIYNVACEHANAARIVLAAFRHQQAEAGLVWSRFDTAVGLLDRVMEALRRLAYFEVRIDLGQQLPSRSTKKGALMGEFFSDPQSLGEGELPFSSTHSALSSGR